MINSEFVKVHSLMDTFIYVALIMAGVLLILLPLGQVIAVFGCFLIVSGIVVALINKTEYKNLQLKGHFKKLEYYYPLSQRAEIVGALMGEPEILLPPDTNKDDVLRLDIYYAKSNDKAYLQLFKYVPYAYEPASIIYELEKESIHKLLD